MCALCLHSTSLHLTKCQKRKCLIDDHCLDICPVGLDRILGFIAIPCNCLETLWAMTSRAQSGPMYSKEARHNKACKNVPIPHTNARTCALLHLLREKRKRKRKVMAMLKNCTQEHGDNSNQFTTYRRISDMHVYSTALIIYHEHWPMLEHRYVRCCTMA